MFSITRTIISQSCISLISPSDPRGCSCRPNMPHGHGDRVGTPSCRRRPPSPSADGQAFPDEQRHGGHPTSINPFQSNEDRRTIEVSPLLKLEAAAKFVNSGKRAPTPYWTLFEQGWSSNGAFFLSLAAGIRDGKPGRSSLFRLKLVSFSKANLPSIRA